MRRAWNIVCVTSLVLCVAMAALCVRSRLRIDSVFLGDAAPRPAPLPPVPHWALVARDEQIQVERRSGDSTVGYHYEPVGSVPLRPLVGAFAVLPAAWMLLARRQRMARRRQLGLCAACGYDLRASPGVCPECGRPVQPASGVAGRETR